MIAALTYVSAFDRESFESFFKDVDYQDIDQVHKELFATMPIIQEKRDIFLKEALEKLCARVYDGNQKMDGESEMHKALIKESQFVPGFINRNVRSYMNPAFPLEILYLLGEIHSSDSFDVLLENYMIDSNFRSAITLAACTGSLQLTQLFDALQSNGLLDTFFNQVFGNLQGNFLEDIRNLSPEEKINYYHTHYEQIMLMVHGRAKPILG